MKKSIAQSKKFTRGLIMSLTNGLLDAEVVVDDRRRAVDDAVDQLRQAEQRRDMLVRQFEAVVDEAA